MRGYYDGEFAGIPAKVGVGAILIGLGLATGVGLFYAFAPAEKARRRRIADARDHLRSTRERCRREIDEAEEAITAARRGELTTTGKRSKRRGSFDLDESDW